MVLETDYLYVGANPRKLNVISIIFVNMVKNRWGHLFSLGRPVPVI